jgi:hypothetical protein
METRRTAAVVFLGFICLAAGFFVRQPPTPPHWYTNPEWWLFIVGVPSLVFLGIQMNASVQAARASTDSANALVATERAWLDGQLTGVVKVGVALYQLEITNRGKSPARLLSYEMNYGCCIKGDYVDVLKGIGGSSYPMKALLGAQENRPIGEPIRLKAVFEDCERWGVCRVTIRYADVISPQTIRCTYFIVRYDGLLGTTEHFTFADSYS